MADQSIAYGTASYATGGDLTPSYFSSYAAGVLGNIKDGNTGTYYGFNGAPSGGFSDSGNCILEFIITFSSPVYIDRVWPYLNISGAYLNTSNVTLIAYDNVGAATTLLNQSNGGSGFPSYNSWFSYEKLCSQITLTLTGRSVNSPGGATLYLQCFELAAFSSYVDSGVHVNTAGSVVALGEDLLSLSSVRTYKSSSVVPLILVPITDPSASPVRVSTSEGIKAIGKVY